MEKEIKFSQIRTKRLQKEIKQMRLLLQGGFEIDQVMELENELKDYEKQADDLEAENDTTEEMHKIQFIALLELKNKSNQGERAKKVKEDVQRKKEDIRDKTKIFHDEEKRMKADHAKMVTLEERHRKLKQLLKFHKKEASSIYEPMKPGKVENHELDELREQILMFEA